MPFAPGNSELFCVIASLRMPVLGMRYPERDLAGNRYSISRPASGRPVTFEDVVDLAPRVDAPTHAIAASLTLPTGRPLDLAIEMSV